MRWAVLGAWLLAVTACGGSSEPSTTAAPVNDTGTVTEPARSGCADVIDASAELEADGTYTFTVTVRSADTGWEKYADAWEVRSPEGAVIGTRELAHPHETEQPFTRNLAGVVVPDGVESVVIAARDSVEGFCGDELLLNL